MKILSLCPNLSTLAMAELDVLSMLQLPANAAQARISQQDALPKTTIRFGHGRCNGGRLGNVLFQYASTLGFMNKTGPNSYMCVDAIAWNHMSRSLPEYHRECGLDQFSEVCRRQPPSRCSFSFQDSDTQVCGEGGANDLLTKVNGLRSEGSCLAIDVTVTGCLQDWRYFHHMSDYIRSHVGVLHSQSEKARAWLADREKELASHQPGFEWRFAGLHVRMGDKVHKQSNLEKYAPVAWSFYRAGVRHVEQAFAASSSKIRIAVIVAVGGAQENDGMMQARDRDVAQSSLRQVLGDVPLLMTPTSDLYDDLALLKLMDAMVIGTSTFGWWAAYLSKAGASDGLVVMPRHKFRQGPGKYCDWGDRSALTNWKVLDNS